VHNAAQNVKRGPKLALLMLDASVDGWADADGARCVHSGAHRSVENGGRFCGALRTHGATTPLDVSHSEVGLRS